MINIALLAGGWSKERGVSLKSGEAVYNALSKTRYHVAKYDPRDDLEKLVSRKDEIDLALIIMHGKHGEDGAMQGLMEVLGIPYMGSGVLASSMAMNKQITKDRYTQEGLTVVKGFCLHKNTQINYDIFSNYTYPIIIKPTTEGSSIGISICNDKGGLIKGIDSGFEFDSSVIVEEYIKGREVTCCVIGDRDLEALPVVEIIPKTKYEFFNFDAKYTSGATNEVCPADIAPEDAQKVSELAIKAHQILGCRHWSRTDMIIRDSEIFLLETNTVPGMTETSLVPLAARAAGMSLADLLDRLIEMAVRDK